MKKFWICFLSLCLCAVILIGCTPAEEQPVTNPEQGDEGTAEEQPDPPAEPEPPRTDFRVVLSSDIHCTHLLEWYGVNYRDRMQHWVDSILYEHEQQPIDLLILNGDLSLDFWAHNGGGSYIKQDISTTQEFVDDFVSQLPDEIEILIFPGNHEQYSNDDWWFITHNDRQEYTTLGNNLFIMVDTFAGDLNPDHHHDGVYSGVDMEYLNAAVAEHPDKDIWLISHYFDLTKESEDFKTFLATNQNIRGLFHGHVHQTGIVPLGEEYQDLSIAVTGNFAYSKESKLEDSFWGFRDLVITANGASSRYIIAESEAILSGTESTYIERHEVDEIVYEY